ncbi:hypothetical protein PHYBLDRAFT_63713 [Phycomyces blakesleeanus NRRL 1555(-)]|uniref:Tc1-like transposase DDE domain-containing protein n=1 Tax=Phycomyces blakesleeanus (strain ATCC 8743b / DSM 1359 / FGSC 10004 / NBRC 33097 / NRRL 1555) TaxID=763407 RepID=A0A167K4W6_PHYB8|nr:hypothetical protein PHYBLDRAFT_63713 [Phycomyces blakesleeanus NRRL 1555(-)]OAD67289.1 hypothetical protein PHYBLDRAFT_63713 [Phycomyces blakesleeanus NRRL 1555(-)]|eukprot:XP_018285329.1 hypothetical protein PHYBLDRAFT_63713 [Phycomyces blakesleeanus NRRL 1555(-)]
MRDKLYETMNEVSLRTKEKTSKDDKKGCESCWIAKCTTTGHYLNFIRKTLDEMDKNPLMKGFFLLLWIILPEFNPIEQFWSVVKNKVKRGVFSNNEDLKTGIAAACSNVSICHLKIFIQHSCNQFDNIEIKSSFNDKCP